MKLTLVIPVYISNGLHLDFTRQTLASIKTSHNHDILIINNFCAPEFAADLKQLVTRHISHVTNPKGNILASAWNLGIKLAFEGEHRHSSNLRAQPDARHRGRQPSTKIVNAELSENKPSDYCIIMNNDLILHPHCLDNLVSFGENHPEFLLWSASEWANQRTLSKAKMTRKFSLHPHFSLFMLSPKTIEVVGYFDENFSMGYFEDNDYHTRILQAGFQAAATDSAKFYHYGSRTINVDDNLKIEGKYHYQKNREYFKKKWGVDIHGQAYDPPNAILKHIKPH